MLERKSLEGIVGSCKVLGRTLDEGEIRDAVAGEHECLVTLLNYRKDGETFWNRFFIAPLRDSEGKVTYYVGVQVDVSEAIAASSAGIGALG